MMVFLSLLFSLTLFAARVELRTETQPKQGLILAAELKIAAGDMNSFQPQRLKGQSFAKTLFFYEVSPTLTKQGSDEFITPVKIIFTKVPEGSSLQENLNGVPVEIFWNGFSVEPTEAAEKLMYQDFEIPSRAEVFRWGLLVLLVIVVAGAGFWIYRWFSRRRDLKKQSQRIRSELTGCQNYSEVVELWRKKHSYLKYHPQLDNNFKLLEAVLFKYQFKPYQSEQEKEEVMQAYQAFSGQVAKELDGI